MIKRFSFVVSLCFLFGIFSQQLSFSSDYHQSLLNDSPVEFWSMGLVKDGSFVEGNLRGTKILIQNSSDLEQVQGPIVSDDCSSAIYINGASLYIPVLPPSGQEDGFSFEFWTKPSDLADGGLKILSNTGASFSFSIDNARGKGGLEIGFGNGDIFTSENLPEGSVRQDVWTHVVFTYNATNESLARIYINGHLVAEKPMIEYHHIPTQFIVSGVQDVGKDNHYKGAISEIAIYDYSLSHTQVYDHYQQSEQEDVASISDGFETDFEVDEYPKGILTKGPWKLTGHVFVFDEDSASLDQSIILSPSSGLTTSLESKFDFGSGDIFFFDFYIKPATNDLSLSPIITGPVSLGFREVGNEIGNLFLSINENHLSLRDFPIENGISTQWIRLSFRMDKVRRIMDLYLDSELLLCNLALDPNFLNSPSIQFSGTPTHQIGLDYFYFGSENPIFEDSDRDGIDDQTEDLIGLDSEKYDRNQDADSDGRLNIDEYRLGTFVHQSDASNGTFKYLYVDADFGDDNFDGLSAYYVSGNRGPKATLSAAARAADEGDTLMVFGSEMPQILFGDEFSQKSLTIHPLGNLIIGKKKE